MTQNGQNKVMRVNYGDNTLRRENEKKWEIIKILYTVFYSSGKPKEFIVPVGKFIVGIVRDETEIERYLDFFQETECFEKYLKSDQKYKFTNISDKKLASMFQKTKLSYKKFSDIYKNKELESKKTTKWKEFPVFDAREGNIVITNENCFIAKNGYEFHICRELFTQKPFDWLQECDVEKSFSYIQQKSVRWVKDAIRRINRKVLKKWNKSDFIEYNGARIRINPDNFSI